MLYAYISASNPILDFLEFPHAPNPVKRYHAKS